MTIEYAALADEMRALARRCKDQQSAEQFLRLADAYDELARGQEASFNPEKSGATKIAQ